MDSLREKLLNLGFTSFLFSLAIACWILGVQIGDKTNGANFGLLFVATGSTYLNSASKGRQETNVERASEVNVGGDAK